MNRPPSSNDLRARWLAGLQADLLTRRQNHLLRELRPVAGPQGPTLTVNGQQYLQFCTNNYLGLANDPEVIDAARAALGRFGAGSGASRLVAGSMDLHHQFETALAAFKHTEAALVCSTGFMANLAVITTFAGPHDRIVSDKLNHASLLDAAKFSGAEHRTFPHRNYERAGALLGKPLRHKGTEALKDADASAKAPSLSALVPQCLSASPLSFLVTDTVFSMDGDLADLPAACAVAAQHNALVVLDEAHATGVLGPHGRGLAEAQGVEDVIALTVGTLSKAFGSIGGFIAGPRAAIDTLINAARPFIYTTALPPACSAASLAALRIIEREPARRQRVLALAAHVKAELTALGYDTGDSATPIIPVILGETRRAVEAAEFLKSRGLWVPAIRPPTVPPNTARLRISLMTTHTDAHVEQLLDAMRQLRTVLPSPSAA